MTNIKELLVIFAELRGNILKVTSGTIVELLRISQKYSRKRLEFLVEFPEKFSKELLIDFSEELPEDLLKKISSGNQLLAVLSCAYGATILRKVQPRNGRSPGRTGELKSMG